MAVARYFKEDVRAVGFTGDATRTTDADGNITWTVSADGATAQVKWKDSTLPPQDHTGLKIGSKITKLKAGGYEIEERT